MNKMSRIERSPEENGLAQEVRVKLSDLEKAVFDVYWQNGRQPSGDLLPKKSKGAASAAANKVRTKLRRFFEGPSGITKPYRLSLTNGTNRQRDIQVEENNLPAASAFWLAHLCDGRRTGFVLSEQLTMRWLSTGERRDWRIRLGLPPSTPIEEVDELMPRPVRLGDVQAMLEVYSYFRRWEAKKLGYLPPQVIGSQSVQVPSEDNLVLLGTSRDWEGLHEGNWYWFPLRLHDRYLYERYGDGTDVYAFGPEPPSLGKRPLECCGVLVSRIHNPSTGRCITVINGTHSVAVRAVCELLTDDKRISSEVVKPLAIKNTEHGFPAKFQIFFAVRLSEDEERAAAIKAFEWRTEPQLDVEPGFNEGADSKLRSAVNSFLKNTAPL
jgi:hypothetical protein